MLIANLKWKPVRLGIERIDSRRYIVSRGGQVRGKVLRDPHSDNKWCSLKAHQPKDRALMFGSPTVRPSFKAAVLALCRHDMLYVSDDGSHAPRLMLVQRVGIAHHGHRRQWSRRLDRWSPRRHFRRSTLPSSARQPLGRGVGRGC